MPDPMPDPEPMPDDEAANGFFSRDQASASEGLDALLATLASCPVDDIWPLMERNLPEIGRQMSEGLLPVETPERIADAIIEKSLAWKSGPLSKGGTTKRVKGLIHSGVAPLTLVEGSKRKPAEPRTPKALSDAVRALGKVKPDGSGPDPQTVMEIAIISVLNGDLDEIIARATLTAAYPEGGDAMFDAAMEKVKASPRTVPILSHKEGLKSADAFIALHHTIDGVRVLHRYQQEFYRWDGAAYRLREEEEYAEPLWRFLALGQVLPSASRVSNVMAALKGIVHLPKSLEPTCWLGDPVDGYPDPKDLVPLRNGLLDPATGTMHPNTPRLFNLSSLPFTYDPADASPPVEWLKFLDDLWDADVQSIECLQEMFGYLLTTDTSLQKMFLIVGPPRSGKGTMGRVLTALLGKENVAAPSLSSLSGEHGLSDLRGKSAALIADAMVSSNTDILRVAEVLKNISGEDPITVNPKYMNPITTTLRARFIILGNEVPRFLDSSNALSSRFIVMVLKRTFLGDEDYGLTTRLLKELPQILHWALAGRARLYERGYFEMPDSAKEVMQELEESSSPIKAFLREKCKVGTNETIEVQRLWWMWQEWSREMGSREGAQVWFFRALRSAVPHIQKKGIKKGAKRVQTLFGVGEAVEAP